MKIQTYSSTIRRKEMDAVLTCLVDEKIGPGELNGRLVQTVKEFFGVPGAVALRSPAIALRYAFSCLGLDSGSGVALSALAPDWQYCAVKEAGYVPLVVDVEPETLMVSEESLDDAVRNGARVFVCHETQGFLPDFETLKNANIPIIEDISQSASACIGEQKAGTFGSYAVLGLEQNDLLTAGGGAVLFSSNMRNWTVLKAQSENAPLTDKLPDMNAALAFVQFKELLRNEEVRRELHTGFIRALMQSRHKSVVQKGENAVSAVWSFPVLLSSGSRDVIQYAAKKDIEVQPAFSDTIIDRRGQGENAEPGVAACKNAASLLLRCVDFPLYPRLGQTNAAKIAKVLATLP